MKGKTSLMWRIFIVLVLVLTLGLITAVPAGAAATWYVNASSTAGGDGTTAATTGTDRAFITIAEAITAAAATTDTIKVYPGTYTEVVAINKELILTGVTAAGVDNWTVGTAGAGAATPSIVYDTNAFMISIEDDNVTIQGFTIDLTDASASRGISFGAGTTDSPTIQYNTFLQDGGDRGISISDTKDVDNFDISYNTFSNSGASSSIANWIAIAENAGTAGTNVISYNTANNTSDGTTGTIGMPMVLGSKDITNITFTYNTLAEALVFYEGAGGVGVYDGLVIKYNTFTGPSIDFSSDLENEDFGGASYDVSDVIIQYNDFTQADMKGLRTIYWDVTGTGTALEARYNYWGDPSGPAVTDNARGAGGTTRIEANIDYEPWLHTTQATVVPSNTRYYAYNWCDLTTGWNIWSTPIAMDVQADTWGEYKALGVDLDLASGSSAYYFNGSSQSWATPGDSYVLSPLDALYIKVASTEEAPILFSASVSAPSKDMYAGWNLVGTSYIDDVLDPVITNVTPAETALATVFTVTGDLTGYSHVQLPTVNETPWTAWRGATIVTDIGQDFVPTKGYWVFMINPGTLAGAVFTPVSPLP